MLVVLYGIETVEFAEVFGYFTFGCWLDGDAKFRLSKVEEERLFCAESKIDGYFCMNKMFLVCRDVLKN